MAFDSFYDGYLVCVLNWGLGHATRCIPIIEKLIAEKKRVIIASDGQALALLKHEFPQLPFYELPSYNVAYSEGSNQISKLILQIPKFALVRYKENKLIEDLVLKERIGFIISDNRYGCHHLECKNYIVSHQLKPILTGWSSIFNFGLELLMMTLFSDFDEIWIPDDESANFSGKLSALAVEDKKYIGILSRMSFIKPINEYAFDIIVILSGPEPQRSLLEQIIIAQSSLFTNTKCLIVRGLVGEIKEDYINEHLKIVSWLDKEFMEDAISKSRFIVCRSGYSSIMDLAAMGKKALLIPTPGQSEQEYLADKMKLEKKFYSVTQSQLNLAKDIQKIDEYTGVVPAIPSSKLTHLQEIFAIQKSLL